MIQRTSLACRNRSPTTCAGRSQTRTGAGGRGRGGATQSQDEINAIVKRKVAQIRDLGVEIVFGTDVGSWGEVTGQATWMEADLWVHELGMDPMTVIRKMTLDAAGVMGAAARVRLAQRREVRGRHRRARRPAAAYGRSARAQDRREAWSSLQIGDADARTPRAQRDDSWR